MQNNKVLIFIHLLLPVIIIFSLVYKAFSTFDVLMGTELILNSLIFYFPIVFLLQGIACALLRANVFVSLGTSTLTFVLVLIIWLNSSAIIYIFAYLIIGLIGYGVTRRLQNRSLSEK